MIGYIQVSDSQRADGESQREAIKAYAAKRGIQITDLDYQLPFENLYRNYTSSRNNMKTIFNASFEYGFLFFAHVTFIL